MTEKTVNDIFNKNDFSDASVMKTVVAVRESTTVVWASRRSG